MLSPEDHQITFPVAKDGALFDPGWTVLDGALGRKHKALRPSRKARSSLPPPVGQVAGEFGRAAFAAVDMGVDRLVADGHRLSFAAQPSCDLFRRPSGLQTVHDSIEERGQPDQLAPPRTPRHGLVLRHHAPVAGEIWQLSIDKPVAPWTCPVFVESV